eukprot:2980685-Rhodomonas_salina.1
MVCHGLELAGRRHLYELIRSEQPCKAYLDVECLLPFAADVSPVRDGLPALIHEYVRGCWSHTADGR